MLNLYKGKLDLTHEKVVSHCDWHARNPNNLRKRQIEKFIYWYSNLDRIRYPVSFLVGQGELMGIHPGTTRLLAQWLSGKRYVDALGVINIDNKSYNMMKEIMPKHERLLSEQAMAFDAGDGHWEFRLAGDFDLFTKGAQEVDWYKLERVEKRNFKSFWINQPGIKWINRINMETIYDKSKTKGPNIEILCNPIGLFKSLAFLVDNKYKHDASYEINTV